MFSIQKYFFVLYAFCHTNLSFVALFALRMREIIFVLPLLFCLSLFGQTRQVVVDWGDKETSTKSVTSRVGSSKDVPPIVGTARFSIGENRYTDVWIDNGFANASSAVLSNVRYETVTRGQLKNMDIATIPNKIIYELSSSRGRNTLYTTLNFTPVINDNGVYKKVVSFSLNYKKGNAPYTNSKIAISNSVLSSGNWYRFRVDKTGVFRINRSFLNSLGMDVNSIDPRQLKIYGNGGNMLPYLNSENTYFDPAEVAIQVVGENDGSFDSNDYILFYGETQQYSEESDTHINLYDDNAYYYITADGGYGKRIQPYTEPSGTSSHTITQFHNYQYHEVDTDNPGMVGRRWFGERFDVENEQSFTFTFPNLIVSEPINYRILAVAGSETGTQMTVSINETEVGQMSFTGIDPNSSDIVRGRTLQGEQNISSEEVTVKLSYNNNGNPASRAFLDYIAIEALCQLTGATGTQFRFQNNEVPLLSGIGTYQIGNANQLSQIWEVTNPFDITALNTEDNSGNISFKANMGQERRYVAVNPGDYYSPIQVSPSTVLNQNLKGSIFRNNQGQFQDVDYLIVTPPQLLQPALRLANHNRTLRGLNVKVVTTDKIYNEFSTGKKDIVAIRNFVKYIYDNASSAENRIRYLCMFGDTSVDYKDRLPASNNMVPTFHEYTNNLSTSSTKMSDDFFTFMDANEGANISTTNKMDIAVGRVIADNVSQANTMVDKIIDYASEESYGNWRNNFLLISDDADDNTDSTLQEDLDALGDQIAEEKPFVNVLKIHSDAYQQETSAGGNRYPDVNKAIKDQIEVGALIVNYFGHGGEDGLSGERIVTRDDIESLRNTDKYFLMVTITCEFTRFDNPLRPTAGEAMYWKEGGGAVAMITTTRTIGIHTGADYNVELASQLYGFNTTDYPTPAEALRTSKNTLSQNGRMIFYLGDPAMELAFPQPEVRLTKLNGVPLGQATDTLKALSRVRFEGEVVNENGGLLNSYNGVLEAKVFDKKVMRQTLGNDGTEGSVMHFQTLGEGIFNGQASVTNGKFEIEFVVPRDIAMPVDYGRVNLYSKKQNALEDQAGANETIKVGGLDQNAPEDNQGPLIQLFMNDENFISGGTTNDSPILIAKLEDEHGINTASGIGHDLIAYIDGDTANPIVLNDYYQSEVDDFTKGALDYRLRDLEDGLHTLTLKAWDVYNNSSTADIQFVVAGSDELKINRVLNYPNPFVNYTEFWFNHNRPFEPLEVQVQVFTVTGKVVWTRNQVVMTDGFLSREIVWDGRDDFGDKIGKGVYVYKLTVKSTLTNKKVEKFEKLVIL